MKKLLVAMAMAVVVALTLPARINADSITPHLHGVTFDADGADNILGGAGAADDGTWIWEYGLALSDTAVAVSADDYGSVPPAPGSAMFQFFDFSGAIDFFGGPSGTGVGEDFTTGVGDVDVSGLFTHGGVGDRWIGVVQSGGLLPFSAATCELALGSACPSDDAAPEVLIAYHTGAPIDTGDLGTGHDNLGVIRIRSIFGKLSDRLETRQSQDCDGNLAPAFDCDGTEDPTLVTDTVYGRYVPPSSAIPEPASMFLLGTGLLGIGSRLRKKSKKDTPSV